MDAEGRVNLSDETESFCLVPRPHEGGREISRGEEGEEGEEGEDVPSPRTRPSYCTHLRSAQKKVYLLLGIHRGHATLGTRWLIVPSMVGARGGHSSAQRLLGLTTRYGATAGMRRRNRILPKLRNMTESRNNGGHSNSSQ